ncbi:MAG: hypothetical protein NTV32_07110 [Gammaproteobacteria bacterium]|nr:hypothetical protein [Gammaproteobacteria bacterium]
MIFQKIWPNPHLTALPLTLLYSGYKRPTAEVIQIVEGFCQKEPARYADLFQRIDGSVEKAKAALLSGDLIAFSEAMRANQVSMQQLGVSDQNLDCMVDYLQANPAILAAKISGSGLGDCVFGLGEAHFDDALPWAQLDVSLSPHGVCIHD